MPTTQTEAEKIIQICAEEGISETVMHQLFWRLHKEVGQLSDNSSVKETMCMLYGLTLGRSVMMSREPKPALVKSPWLFAWGSLLIGHFVLWFALWAACLVSMFTQPWNISIFVICFCIYLVTVDVTCPLTNLENIIRKQLDWPPIAHFTNHYVIWPVAKLFK